MVVSKSFCYDEHILFKVFWFNHSHKHDLCYGCGGKGDLMSDQERPQTVETKTKAHEERTKLRELPRILFATSDLHPALFTITVRTPSVKLTVWGINGLVIFVTNAFPLAPLRFFSCACVCVGCFFVLNVGSLFGKVSAEYTFHRKKCALKNAPLHPLCLTIPWLMMLMIQS